jgi:hypothetical protein
MDLGVPFERHPLFVATLVDKLPGWSARKAEAEAEGGAGAIMFAVVVGIVLALIFLGLPLAIIALFIASNLDRSAKWQALRDTIARLKVDYTSRQFNRQTLEALRRLHCIPRQRGHRSDSSGNLANLVAICQGRVTIRGLAGKHPSRALSSRPE